MIRDHITVSSPDEAPYVRHVGWDTFHVGIAMLVGTGAIYFTADSNAERFVAAAILGAYMLGAFIRKP